MRKAPWIGRLSEKKYINNRYFNVFVTINRGLTENLIGVMDDNFYKYNNRRFFKK